MQPMLYFNLEGADLTPAELRSRELANVITALETTIAALVQAGTPEIKLEQVRLSLVDVRPGSTALTFTPNMIELTMPAALRLIDAIRGNQFIGFPAVAIQNLRKIVLFLRSRHGVARLRIGEAGNAAEVTIAADLDIFTEIKLRGYSSLYGTVIRVGGVEPRVEFSTVNGRTLFCPTDRAIVLQLREYLYLPVAIHGLATWDAISLDVTHFTIDSWHPYRPTSPTQAFAELREKFGGFFDAIDDVDAWVASVRRGDK